MTKYFIFPFFLGVFLASCSKDDNPVVQTPPGGIQGLYILNEGVFNRNNASLSLYLPDSGRVYADIFKTATGRDLGDVGQSLTMHFGRLYIVVNNSDKIEVLDGKTHAAVKTISCPSGASPRYITFGAGSLAYISNLYRNSVSVYDDSTDTLIMEIPVGNNPEQILFADGKIFVANSGFGNGRTISVIDPTSNTVVKTLGVSDSPVSIEPLSVGTALVLCTGAYNNFQDTTDDTPGKLFWINTATQAVIDSLTLGGHPSRLTIDGSNRCYTVQADGIQRINLSDKTIVSRFIPGYFYSILADSKRGRLYLTRPLDYTQPGKLDMYDMQGNALESQTVGVIPGYMLLAQ